MSDGRLAVKYVRHELLLTKLIKSANKIIAFYICVMLSFFYLKVSLPIAGNWPLLSSSNKYSPLVKFCFSKITLLSVMPVTV